MMAAGAAPIKILKFNCLTRTEMSRGDKEVTEYFFVILREFPA
jgi:hypothetical protein